MAIGVFLLSPLSDKINFYLAKDRLDSSSESEDSYYEEESLNIKDEYLYNSNSPKVGSDQTAVKIVIFSDYQCPYCSDANETIDDLIEKYGDKIQLIHRDFVVHPTATIHAQAGQAANLQGKFWEMNNELFSNSNLDIEDEDDVAALAEKLSFDVDRFKLDLNSDTVQAIIDQDKTDAANIGLTGTPTIFLNGEKTSASGLEAKIKVIIGE